MKAGRAVFAATLRLLPSAVRARVVEEMQAIYDARMAEASNARARLVVWVTEMWGAAAALWRLRSWRRVAQPTRAFDGELSDVRLAFRGLTRRPGASVLAVLTVGLGIGSASAMFSVVDGVLLRPLPWPDADRVVAIYPTIEEWRTHPSLSASWDRARFSPPEFADWAKRQMSFAAATPLASFTRHLTGRGPAELVSVGVASMDPPGHRRSS